MRFLVAEEWSKLLRRVPWNVDDFEVVVFHRLDADALAATRNRMRRVKRRGGIKQYATRMNLECRRPTYKVRDIAGRGGKGAALR